jgi:glucose/arabinose dehydrogenase
VLDPASRRAILDLSPGGQHPVGGGVNLNLFHNASTVMFGPDGMLYVGMGDGGGECNSAWPGAPQDVTVPLGKILRLDPNAAPPHGVPDNPFAADGDPRVLHYGVRNPFRFSFDSMTGDLYVGDVGQWDFEEISFAPAGSQGLNFGWPDYEGEGTDTCPDGTPLRPGSTYTPPIHSIAHGTDAGAANLIIAVVGGVVYRGDSIPELYGAYLFGEYYASRQMGALYQCGDDTSPVVTVRKRCDPNFPNDSCFVPVAGAPALADLGAIVEGHDHELYLVANLNSLLRVVPAAP